MNGQENTPAAAHYLLQIPEILHEITQHLDYRTLFQTMAVSTALHDASIRRYWSGMVLDTFGDIVEDRASILARLRKLLPHDLTGIRSAPPEVWSRFKHYAAHVQGVYLKTTNRDIEFFTVLGDAPFELFPRLRTLSVTWEFAVKNPRLQWMGIRGPRLRSLSIGGHDARFRDCLPILGLICQQILIHIPELEELSCYRPLDINNPWIPSESRVAIESIAASMRCMKNLRSFSWLSHPVPQPILYALSVLPRLDSLHSGNQPPLDESQRDPQTHFPALRRFATKGPPDAWFSALMDPQQLTHLELSSIWQRSPPFHSYGLVSVIVEFEEGVTWVNLEPLMSCKSIRIFRLKASGGVKGYCGHSMSIMASSWRGLEELSFHEHERAPGNTMLGFAFLATQCSNLRDLSLSTNSTLCFRYDDTWEEDYRHVIEGSYPSSPLESLRLTLIPPHRSTELEDGGLGFLGVAILITRLWPSLDPARLEQNQRITHPYHPWNAVESAMRAINLHVAERERLIRAVNKQESELSLIRDELQRKEEYIFQLVRDRARSGASGSFAPSTSVEAILN